MKRFEISTKQNKDGRRKFKVVLFKIHPDSCIDEVNQVGTQYNGNGITWIREYCEKALPSIAGMSIRCEFADEDRTSILGHGETGVVDGIPTFEDAVVLGTFTNGYIDDIDTEDGVITACIGEGEIDAQCYHNFVTKLEEDIANDVYPSGSVEIMHTEDNEGIVYKYGYKDVGRIPTEFIFSGYALLGVKPADEAAKMIELNEDDKEEQSAMNENDVRAVVAQTIDEMKNRNDELNALKSSYEAQIAELNSAIDQITNEKNEGEATAAEIKKALEDLRAEFEELDKKYNELWSERDELRKALAEAQARERVAKMESEIEQFAEDERNYAKDMIDAFKADPQSGEINAIVSKIWEGIGRNAKSAEALAAEQNSANDDSAEDIFSEVSAPKTEDDNIF